jgi:hypothetical protein
VEVSTKAVRGSQRIGGRERPYRRRAKDACAGSPVSVEIQFVLRRAAMHAQLALLRLHRIARGHCADDSRSQMWLANRDRKDRLPGRSTTPTSSHSNARVPAVMIESGSSSGFGSAIGL